MTITALASFWRFTREKKKFDKVDHVHEFCTCANFNQFVTYFPNNREIWFTKMAMKNIHDFHSFYFASTRLLFFSGFENLLEIFGRPESDKIGCLAFRRLQKIREKFIQCFQNSLIKGFFPPNKFVILALLLNIGVD